MPVYANWLRNCSRRTNNSSNNSSKLSSKSRTNSRNSNNSKAASNRTNSNGMARKMQAISTNDRKEMKARPNPHQVRSLHMMPSASSMHWTDRNNRCNPS